MNNEVAAISLPGPLILWKISKASLAPIRALHLMKSPKVEKSRASLHRIISDKSLCKKGFTPAFRSAQRVDSALQFQDFRGWGKWFIQSNSDQGWNMDPSLDTQILKAEYGVERKVWGKTKKGKSSWNLLDKSWPWSFGILRGCCWSITCPKDYELLLEKFRWDVFWDPMLLPWSSTYQLSPVSTAEAISWWKTPCKQGLLNK